MFIKECISSISQTFQLLKDNVYGTESENLRPCTLIWNGSPGWWSLWSEPSCWIMVTLEWDILGEVHCLLVSISSSFLIFTFILLQNFVSRWERTSFPSAKKVDVLKTCMSENFLHLTLLWNFGYRDFPCVTTFLHWPISLCCWWKISQSISHPFLVELIMMI